MSDMAATTSNIQHPTSNTHVSVNHERSSLTDTWMWDVGCRMLNVVLAVFDERPQLTRSLLVAVMLGVACSPATYAQSDAILAVREYVDAHQHQIVDELVAWLSLPNVAVDLPAMQRNAEALVAMMERRGIEARILETGGAPYVYGELEVPGAVRTVIFYSHFDGQPVDRSRWVGHDPFEPVLREGSLADDAKLIEFPEVGGFDPDWRIYARSASDDKSPIVALMTALDALRAAGIEPSSNLKFVFEGDEEAGSPTVRTVISEYRDLLGADLFIAADGPRDPSGRPSLYFGARGIVSAEITVYGPVRPLHSGHYGNWAPNPAMQLAQLLASMKDPETGRVLIEGFYDDVEQLSDLELEAIRRAPNDDAEQMSTYGIAETELGGNRLLVINQPSLNVRGIRSGWVGDEARTIIPDVAIASIDMRLVKNVLPQDQVRRLMAHIERMGFHVVEAEPDLDTRRSHKKIARVVTTNGYPAFRTPMDLPVSQALVQALEKNSGQSAVALPTLGGSVPLYYYTDVLRIPTIGVPIVNHDNNQHSPNENVRLGHFFSGIEILAAAMLIE